MLNLGIIVVAVVLSLLLVYIEDCVVPGVITHTKSTSNAMTNGPELEKSEPSPMSPQRAAVSIYQCLNIIDTKAEEKREYYQINFKIIVQIASPYICAVNKKYKTRIINIEKN